MSDLRKLNEGLTQGYTAAYINGQLPPGWEIGKITVVDKQLIGGAVVSVSATHPERGKPVGIRIELEAGEVAAFKLDPMIVRIIEELAPKVRDADRRRAPQLIRFSLAEGAKAPVRGSEHAAGYDLYALSACVLNPGQVLVVDTGVHLELPIDTNGEVRPRSGMSKRGLMVIVGTVDEDFRGPIGATIANLTRETQAIAKYDRIAQLVIAPVIHKPWHEVDLAELSQTVRGSSGWGSSGK